MTERTYNIIMACKKTKHGNIVDAAREYMAKECDCPIESYTEFVISAIMETAMYDYIDSCDKPSIFLRHCMDCERFHYQSSFGEKIAIAFRNVRVRDREGNYINGFGEWAK